MASTPTFFFIHGAWHQPAHYGPIMATLEAAGYSCVCPQEKSFNVPLAEMKGFKMDTDAKAIRADLERVISEEQKDVLVVMHSYGGVVGTQAVDETLGVKARSARGLKGGVIRLVYMCAFVLPPNSSLGDAFGGELPPIIKTEPDGSCNMIDPRKLFYEQLDDATAAKWLDLCKPHPASAQLSPISYTAYMFHPISYIVCTEDPALPPEVQRGMIQGCRDKGLMVDVHEVAADHSPYLGRMPETVAILQKIAAA